MGGQGPCAGVQPGIALGSRVVRCVAYSAALASMRHAALAANAAAAAFAIDTHLSRLQVDAGAAAAAIATVFVA